MMTSLYAANNNNMGLVKTTLLASSFGSEQFFISVEFHGNFCTTATERMDKSPLKSRADEQQVETRSFNTSQWL
jgi:hypothetical protein